jgi:pseudaminic acid synthase
MKIKLQNKCVGQDCSVFIISEISANHNQDFKHAVDIIETVKQCGADAVKFQAYTPDTLTIDADNDYFQIKHPKWGGQTLYQLYKKAYTPWKWFKELKKIAEDIGLIFLCTAYDRTSVDMLEELDICAYKIASFELVDLPLIKYASKTGRPLIMSTGMADMKEIREAVDTAKKSGAEEIILLKCTSSYPANPKEMNLKTIPDMENRFKCPIGLSDHSLSLAASICAVSFGACIIEKHFTMSRKNKTPDSFFSLEPHELKNLINNIRIAEKAIGKVHYGLTEEERKSRIFRRSLFVVKDINKGEIFTEENLKSIRPANGLSPKHIILIMGHSAKKNIKKGTPLTWDLVD